MEINKRFSVKFAHEAVNIDCIFPLFGMKDFMKHSLSAFFKSFVKCCNMIKNHGESKTCPQE